MDNVLFACSGCGETFQSEITAKKCCDETYYTVSECCEGDVVTGSYDEEPLNDGWTITYEIEVCEKCGKEVEV